MIELSETTMLAALHKPLPFATVLLTGLVAGLLVSTAAMAAQAGWRQISIPGLAEWVGRNLPGTELHRVPNAWHFAFMDSPSTAIATEDGDVAANPPGFDRPAFLARPGREIPAFFDKALP